MSNKLTFTHHEKLLPVFDKASVAVCFASDDKFSPYLGVALQSLVDNANKNYNYDIIILTEFISDDNQRQLLSIVDDFSNISLRVYNVTSIHEQYGKEFYIQEGFHVDVPTYYRFYISHIFEEYDKVVYLDADIIINKDIADLYYTDLEGYVFGVNYDVLAYHEYTNDNIAKQQYNKLNMPIVGSYFNAGIMIFNIKECIQRCIFDELIKTFYLLEKPQYADQDILNYMCYHNHFPLKRISLQWNYGTILKDLDNLSDVLSEQWIQEIIETEKHIYLYHFASRNKPWKNPFTAYADVFWNYARKTPFYEKILFTNIIENMYIQLRETLREKIGSSILWKLGKVGMKLLKKIESLFWKK